MEYQVNFGSLKARGSKPAAGEGFRIALLGDFSAGANRGRLEKGGKLADRKPLVVDCDNLDAILARLKIKMPLPVGPEGGAVELSFGSMDDFHPDQLFANLEIFDELSGLRSRLESSSTFAKAAKELQSWAGASAVAPIAPPAAPARGSVIPTDGKLSDFSALIGRPGAPAASPVDELLRQVVAPYVVAAKDPRQDAMVDAVDEALSASMRAVLHHPDFQALESLWRSVDFLVRRLETDESLQIILYDISAEELAADLSAADALENSALYRLLVEDPASDADRGPLSAVIGLYTFERTPPHAELLGRIARIVAQAQAPFISSLSADCLDQDPKDLHPLIKQSWGELRAMPEAGYLALACPRFLLRLPYGKKTEPIEAFEFEEFSIKMGLRGMLWGNPAVIAALLLGQTFVNDGAEMTLGGVMSVGEMPFYYFVDKDGDQVALPCTERLMTARLSSLLTTQNLMPLVCMKGAPEVRLGSFGAFGGHEIGGPWAPLAITETTPAKAPVKAEPPPAKVEEPPEEPEAEAESEPAAEAAPAPAPEATPEATPEAAPSELDSLLSDMADKKEEKQEEAQEEEMDPELKALLEGL